MNNYMISEESWEKLNIYNKNYNNCSFILHAKVSAILAYTEILKEKNADFSESHKYIGQIEELSKGIIAEFHKSFDSPNNYTSIS